jgi:hypothetical protein
VIDTTGFSRWSFSFDLISVPLLENDTTGFSRVEFQFSTPLI